MLQRSLLLAVSVLVAAGIALSACSSGKSTPDLAPAVPTEPAITQQPMAPLPTGPMTAGDITRALAERKFSFASAGRKGTVTYFKDGTFEYDEAGKGSGTGIWQPDHVGRKPLHRGLHAAHPDLITGSCPMKHRAGPASAVFFIFPPALLGQAWRSACRAAEAPVAPRRADAAGAQVRPAHCE